MEIVCTLIAYRGFESLSLRQLVMVVSVGPLATQSCEPRQVRKEAAAAAEVCAGVWLALAAALLLNLKSFVTLFPFFRMTSP